MRLGQRIVGGCEDVNHQRIGDELTVVDVLLGGVAEFGAGLDFSAQHITGGDVVEAIFLNQEVALRAFARTGSTEDDKIFHVSIREFVRKDKRQRFK